MIWTFVGKIQRFVSGLQSEKPPANPSICKAHPQTPNGVNCPLFADWNIFGSKGDEAHSSLAVVAARDGFTGHGFAHSDSDAMD